MVNKAKTKLRLMSPLGKQKQEREKDEQFLTTFTTPEDILEMGRIVKKHMDKQAGVLDESRMTPKTGGRREVGPSTLMSGISLGYSLRKLKGRERGLPSSMPAKDKMAMQGHKLQQNKVEKRTVREKKTRKEDGGLQAR